MDLAEARARTAALLMDAAALIWDADTLDGCVRAALEEFSNFHPRRCEAVVDLPVDEAGSVDLSGLAGLLDVLEVGEVQPPVDGGPPLCRWETFQDNGLYLYVWNLRPGHAGQARLIYSAGYGLAGLDGAEETSLLDAHVGLLVTGAAGYAARARVVQRGARLEMGAPALGDLLTASQTLLAEFHTNMAALAAGCWLTARWD